MQDAVMWRDVPTHSNPELTTALEQFFQVMIARLLEAPFAFGMHAMSLVP
jgi:hypothetical protein